MLLIKEEVIQKLKIIYIKKAEKLYAKTLKLNEKHL